LMRAQHAAALAALAVTRVVALLRAVAEPR